MRFLVFGAGGAQGGAVARRLAEAGFAVRGVSRARAVPEGVEPFQADLGDAGRVREAFAGVTHVSLVLPLEFEPDRVAAYVRHVVAAATAAGVRRLVFCTGNRLPRADTGEAAFEAGLAAVMGARTATGVASTYRWIAGRGHDLYAAPPGGAERLGIKVTSPATWAATR
ncbi:NmrA family NAD(P)-binding protein [Nonomuraea purpurea]|uniref:NmrA family NAD(P)-binding protein n=1 Tax=Nonomuraea purpurea TaxID=1849276 RepID=A0ABV8GP03_9ACTN